MTESASHKPAMNKPALRVLQILPALEAGGVERTTVDVTEALIERGHEAHVLSAGGRMADEISALGGHLHQANIGSKNILTLVPRIFLIVKLVKTHDINIIHARSRAPAWPAFFAAKMSRAKFVTTYHGIYNSNSRLKTFYNSIMTWADSIIANSEFTCAHIIKTHGVKGERITSIPRGVDMKLFDPTKVSKDMVDDQRAKWGEKGDKFIVLPGRLTRWKGQLDAIEALQHLPKNCKLILVGDAQGREGYVKEIEDKIAGLGQKGRVIIEGHRTDIPLILSSAHIVLSASNEPEAFGRVAIEAQAMSRPIVATALGGALETVDPGKTGWLVDAQHPAAMAQAIKRALAWPKYDGSQARSRIARYYSRKSLQVKTLKVYSDLLAPKKR
jgi:glycosyltransferase involved in cell wall biosynthesis